MGGQQSKQFVFGRRALERFDGRSDRLGIGNNLDFGRLLRCGLASNFGRHDVADAEHMPDPQIA